MAIYGIFPVEGFAGIQLDLRDVPELEQGSLSPDSHQVLAPFASWSSVVSSAFSLEDSGRPAPRWRLPLLGSQTVSLARALIREQGPSRGQLGLGAFCADSQGWARLRFGQGLPARSGHL